MLNRSFYFTDCSGLAGLRLGTFLLLCCSIMCGCSSEQKSSTTLTADATVDTFEFNNLSNSLDRIVSTEDVIEILGSPVSVENTRDGSSISTFRLKHELRLETNLYVGRVQISFRSNQFIGWSPVLREYYSSPGRSNLHFDTNRNVLHPARLNFTVQTTEHTGGQVSNVEVKGRTDLNSAPLENNVEINQIKSAAMGDTLRNDGEKTLSLFIEFYEADALRVSDFMRRQAGRECAITLGEHPVTRFTINGPLQGAHMELTHVSYKLKEPLNKALSSMIVDASTNDSN